MTNENETTTASDEAVEDTPPTLAEVEREEAKMRELRDRLDELPEEIRGLDETIAAAIANGDPGVSGLRSQRRELVELSGDLEAAHEVLVARAEERRETATRAMAESRLEEIAEEHEAGGVQLAKDVDDLVEAARTYEAAAAEVSNTFGALVVLEAEADEVLKRWPDLDPPELSTAIPPGRTHTVKAARTTVAKVTIPARTPRRVSTDGTPGADIIAESGGRERPDFVLSDEELAERRKAEARAAERERRGREQEERARAELARMGGGHRVELTRIF